MRKKIIITVCDVCENDKKKTQRVRITGELGAKTLDLCSTHIRPIARLLPSA